jgi:inorganic pyrophosphatase
MSKSPTDTRLYCRVEIPQGSRNKYEWDSELGEIFLSRFLFSSVVYPTDYGFFPETLAEDGDPLDALICVSEPTFPGCMIEVKAIGVLRMSDEEGPDDKILCVPCRDPNWMNHEQVEDISDQLRGEIEHFFRIYKEREGKPVEVRGWQSRGVACEVIEACRGRYHASRVSSDQGGVERLR